MTMTSLSNSQQIPGFDLRQKVSDLSQKLLEKHPSMPTLLEEIHKNLRAQPENVTLLSEEEIGVIVEGLTRQTQVEFVNAQSKPLAARGIKSKIDKLGAGAF